MKTIYLTTKPVSINKRYTIARGRNILSNEYRNAKEAITWEIKTQWSGEPIENENVAVNILIYYVGHKPDIDAYCKIIFDSLEGIVVKNDGLINEAHIFREKVETDPKVIIQIL